MSSNKWKQVAKVSLALCVLALPVWAFDGDSGKHRCDDRDNRGYGRDCGGKGGRGKNVPEGGLLPYAALSIAVAAGGLVLARKSR